MSYQQGYPQGGYGAPPQGYGAPPPSAGYASIGKRFLAYILDAIIVCVGTIPGWIVFAIATAGAVSTAGPSGRMSDEAAGAFVGVAVLAYLLIFVGALIVGLYNIYLLGRDGATLGKRWMKIKVLDPQGQPLGFGKAFLRELVKGVLGNICFILLFWPLWDAEKQGLYDKLFSTHVFEAPA
jgi:uncharacterized RDD family membrane protein YckC